MLFFKLFVLISFAWVQAIDYDEYTASIEQLALDPLFVLEFEKHIDNILEIEPNYFNYTPFNSPDYKFDCQVDLDAAYEPATSVHRLRHSWIDMDTVWRMWRQKRP